MAIGTLVGLDRHLKRVVSMREAVEEGTSRELIRAANAVKRRAVRSIAKNTIRGFGHIPSRPGQPPKGDTGNLERGIQVEYLVRDDRAESKSAVVISRAIYSAVLEFGGLRIAARPFMRPAMQAERARFVQGMVSLASGRAAVRVFKNSTRSIDEAMQNLR